MGTKEVILTAITMTWAVIVLLSFPAQAQDREYYPIGQIVEIEGRVFFSANNNRKKAKIDDPVYLNTAIETEADSRVMILFIDDTQLILAESTELIIDEFVFDPYEPEENIGEFDITKGSFHWLSGMLSKRERPQVKIKTGVGSIGIRGTEFWAGAIEDGYGVFVDDGLVNFAGEWGAVDLPSGSGVFLKPRTGNAPDPDFWNAIRREKALRTVTFSRPEGDIEERLQELYRENVRKRHDYRGQMFPYKQPPAPGYLPEEDEFFTDEFNEMRDTFDKNR